MKSIKQKLLSSVCISLLILLCIILYSCKDDVVTSPPPPPTPVNDDAYAWDMKIVHGYLRGIYAADTENVYVNQGYNLLKFNGDTLVDFPLNDPGFALYGMDGFDKNNVFVGGGYDVTGGNPILKKIQNGVVISYTIANDNGRHISDVFCTGPDEAWISTERSNKVYRFSGGFLEGFDLDDSVYYSYFFKDVSSQLFSFGMRRSYFILNGTLKYSELLYIYKFNNTNFQKLRIDTIYSPYTGLKKTIFLNRCGADLMMSIPLLRFTGSDWEVYPGYPPEQNFILTHIGGVSKDSLLMFCSNYGIMYIWNGAWNKEDSFLAHITYPGVELGGAGGPTIIIKEPNVYFTVSAPMNSDSYFIIGRRIKTDSKEMYRLKK
jgi:hypothetical protein